MQQKLERDIERTTEEIRITDERHRPAHCNTIGHFDIAARPKHTYLTHEVFNA